MEISKINILIFSFLLFVFLEDGRGQISAEVCGDCHSEEYEQWSESMHSKSTPVNNILFAKVYKKSQLETNGKTKLYCTRCHAPVSTLNGDFDFKEGITQEGVTCDICHTAKSLSLQPEHWPIIYESDQNKLNSYRDFGSSAHQENYLSTYPTSRLCSSCHGTMINISGMQGCSDLTICDTYGESQMAQKPEECQNCHQGHSFQGVHSGEMLKKAAQLDLQVQEFGGKINLVVNVMNNGTGHRLPTGPPTRMVYLKVSAYDGEENLLWTNFKENLMKEDPYGVFHIVFADSSDKVPAFPWIAAKIFKDTRMDAGESRELIYKFPAEGVKKIDAKLFYRLAPLSLLDKFEITDEYLRAPHLMTDVAYEIK
ncbi:MAG: hypothetical protein JSW63_10785 [Ignavibacterium sp.]|nr:MAG: hypothetical protein JSW63_10785 [Ignavibacterium sp.]